MPRLPSSGAKGGRSKGRGKPQRRNPKDYNLYRRPGSDTWYVRFETAGGGERRYSLRTDDIEKARDARDEIFKGLADAELGIVAPEPKTDPTWADAVNLWLAELPTMVAKRRLSPKTADRYEISIDRISEYLEGMSLKDITRKVIKGFIKHRFADEKSVSTVKNDLTAWSQVFVLADEEELFEGNPVSEIKRKKLGTDADDLDPPRDVEVFEMVEELRRHIPNMALLIEWLRETGMRLGEALALRWTDIHPGGRWATVSRAVKLNKGGMKTRTINLGRAALLLDRLPGDGRVFSMLKEDSTEVSSDFGQFKQQRQERENRLAALEGREPVQLRTWRFHDLRHAFAIASVIDGPTEVYRLMQHLGHSSIRVTEMYVRMLVREGNRKYARRTDLYGALPADVPMAPPPARLRA